MKKIIAIGIMCVCFLFPVLCMTEPSFPDVIPNDYREVHGTCSCGKVLRKHGEPMRCLGADSIIKVDEALHKQKWAQNYKCTGEGCGNGFCDREEYEFEPHFSLPEQITIVKAESPYRKKIENNQKHTYYYLDTKTCACGHSENVVRSVTSNHSKRSRIEYRNGRPYKIWYTCPCGWSVYSLY